MARRYSAASGGASSSAPASGAGPSSSSGSFSVEFDIEAERADFLDQDVEALGNARLEGVVAADDGLVDLGAAGDVVRLDGEHFLQGVGGAIGFEGPDFHFAEALTAELRLAAQRLLGDERVRTDRTGVDLVVDEVVQLQHVDVAHRHLAVEGLAGTSVIERPTGRSRRAPPVRAS